MGKDGDRQQLLSPNRKIIYLQFLIKSYKIDQAFFIKYYMQTKTSITIFIEKSFSVSCTFKLKYLARFKI